MDRGQDDLDRTEYLDDAPTAPRRYRMEAGLNWLLNARMREVGIRSPYALAVALVRHGHPFLPGIVHDLYHGLRPARRLDGKWSLNAEVIAEFLGRLPEDLFDAEHQWRPGHPATDPDALARFEEERRSDSADANVEQVAETSALETLLDNVLARLDAKERQVVRLRYGLGGETEHTLEEVAEKYGVTRTRIWQIEDRALAKLRSAKVKAEIRLAGLVFPRRVAPALQEPARPVRRRSRHERESYAVMLASGVAECRWPDLSAYGVRMRLWITAKGTVSLVVENDPDVPNAALGREVAGLRRRADYYRDELRELDFGRRVWGDWARRPAEMSVDEVLEVFPEAKAVTVAMEAVTTRTPAPEAPEPEQEIEIGMRMAG